MLHKFTLWNCCFVSGHISVMLLSTQAQALTLLIMFCNCRCSELVLTLGFVHYLCLLILCRIAGAVESIRAQYDMEYYI